MQLVTAGGHQHFIMFNADIYQASIQKVPGGFPVLISLIVIISTTIVVCIYVVLNRKHRPLPDFPLASIDGFDPKMSWMIFGRQLLEESLTKVPHLFALYTS